MSLDPSEQSLDAPAQVVFVFPSGTEETLPQALLPPKSLWGTLAGEGADRIEVPATVPAPQVKIPAKGEKAQVMHGTELMPVEPKIMQTVFSFLKVMNGKRLPILGQNPDGSIWEAPAVISAVVEEGKEIERDPSWVEEDQVYNAVKKMMIDGTIMYREHLAEVRPEAFLTKAQCALFKELSNKELVDLALVSIYLALEDLTDMVFGVLATRYSKQKEEIDREAYRLPRSTNEPVHPYDEKPEEKKVEAKEEQKEEASSSSPSQ